jgi:ribosomal protein S12 methylthiotransferase
MNIQPTVNLVTLGCSKNLVDSEYLARQLQLNGFQVSHESGQPHDVTIINTCGFINDAKQESIESILAHAAQKQQGTTSRVYVMGCLSQRYREELKAEIPEVDGFFGVYEQPAILKELKAAFRPQYSHQRILATPNHYAYLKVAEGCNRKCSFCSIPLIKGNYTSKPIEELEKEARFLAGTGVKEVNLIAQDLSYYGYDLHKRALLPELIRRLDRMDRFEWIRMLYAYPAGFPTDVLDLMKDSPHICSYLDIPVQHISDRILKAMRRGHTRKQTYQILNLIRSKLPGSTLRTTLLVGYPGETEKDFNELVEFVREVRFDRLGVFTYSEEEGTRAAQTSQDDVPQRVKEERADEIMRVQQEISYRKNREKIGRNMRVLIDGEDHQFLYGRSEADAPEVDNGVLIKKADHPHLQPGEFYEATVTDASDYDLYATIGKGVKK